MDNATQYARETCQGSRWLLGVRLPALTFGHVQQLRAIGSPFLSGTPVKIEDLMTALWICSRDWAGSRARVGRSWCWRARLVCWLATKSPELIQARIDLFAQYLREGMGTGADKWQDPKLSRSSAVPPMLLRRRALMHEYGYSSEEFWNLPHAQALYEYDAWLDHECAVEFQSEADRDLKRRARLPKPTPEHTQN